MQFYERINGALIPRDIAGAAETEKTEILEALKKYEVYFAYTDTADDDADSGMGIVYDRSYSYYAEPAVSAVVLENGKFFGVFVTDKENGDPVILTPAHPDYLDIETALPHCSTDTRWELVESPVPGLAKIVYGRLQEKNEGRVFRPADFPQGIVKTVQDASAQHKDEKYTGTMFLWLELTDDALTDRFAAEQLLADYGMYDMKFLKRD